MPRTQAVAAVEFMRTSSFHLFKKQLLFSALLLGVCLTACNQAQTAVTVRTLPVQPIHAPFGASLDVVWLNQQKLVVWYESELDSLKRTYHLWQVNTDGSELQMLNLPADSQPCIRNEFYPSQVLSDRRMTFLRRCVQYPQDRDQRILIWNPIDGTSQILRDYDLPLLYVRVSFAPDLSLGILGTYTGIQEDLYWLDPNQARKLNIGFARASENAWSPDGKSIVFFGNQQIGGEPGPGWASKPYDLWLMPANCETLDGGCAKHLQLLLNSIFNQTAVNWSPDSHWIVFDGDLQGRGQGIWLRRMETGELVQVLAGDHRHPHWSPDGKRLVVIGPPEGSKNIDLNFRSGTALYILDVSEVVSK